MSPAASPRLYEVRRGDTLSSIGDRFGLKIDQLLAANPHIDDADHLEAGDILTIPSPGSAPPPLPGSAGLEDQADDVTDAQEQLALSLDYVDATRFTARIEGGDLLFRLELRGEPPVLDPTGEDIRYRFLIDTNADDVPDYRVVVTNAVPRVVGYAPVLFDLRAGQRIVRGAFPGGARIEGASVFVRLARRAIGSPRRMALAASVERTFFLDPDRDRTRTEVSRDRIPDRQWPRPEPSWLVVGSAR